MLHIFSVICQRLQAGTTCGTLEHAKIRLSALEIWAVGDFTSLPTFRETLWDPPSRVRHWEECQEHFGTHMSCVSKCPQHWSGIAWPVMVGLRGTEMSVREYHSALRKIQKERGSPLNRSRRLKSRNTLSIYLTVKWKTGQKLCTSE